MSEQVVADLPRGRFRPAKDHPMFPPEFTALIRFYVAAKGEKLDPCPACGSRRRGRWTMLCPFTAHTFGAFALREAGEFPPLTLICSDHPMSPTDAIKAAL